jgi:hypothetical protein
MGRCCDTSNLHSIGGEALLVLPKLQTVSNRQVEWEPQQVKRVFM